MPARVHGWELWKAIGSPVSVCAPMVDQSELAFRRLSHSLGVGLSYTPMLHARLMSEAPVYRQLHFDGDMPYQSGGATAHDGPCFAQLAGHDPKVVLRAARHVEAHVDAVDLNFGCPQNIAKRGRYGAFLLDEPDVMVSLVSTLHKELSVPVTAKLRLLPSVADSVALCRRLQDAGASVICVHGRRREEKKQFVGAADWSAIASVVSALEVPVIANGGIGSVSDVAACLEATGAAAVMSSEGVLENPALFCANKHPHDGRYLDQHELASLFLDECLRLDAHDDNVALKQKRMAQARSHLFKMLHNGLREPAMRDQMLATASLADLKEMIETLRGTDWVQPRFHTEHQDFSVSWYARHQSAAAEEEAVPEMTLEQRKAELKQRLAKRLAESAARQNGAGAPVSAAHKGSEQERERLFREAKAKKENHSKARKARNRKRQTLKAERLQQGVAPVAGRASLQG